MLKWVMSFFGEKKYNVKYRLHFWDHWDSFEETVFAKNENDAKNKVMGKFGSWMSEVVSVEEFK